MDKDAYWNVTNEKLQIEIKLMFIGNEVELILSSSVKIMYIVDDKSTCIGKRSLWPNMFTWLANKSLPSTRIKFVRKVTRKFAEAMNKDWYGVHVQSVM